MKRNKSKFIILGLLIVIACFFFFTTILERFQSTALTKQQATEKIERLYNGSAQFVTEENGQYFVTLKRQDGDYEVVINAASGHIHHVTKTKMVATVPPSTNETTSTQIITNQMAQQIALEQMEGEIEDSEFVQTNDGGYYLIEVDNKKEEATFQIHAVTGTILSISYDD